MNNSVDESNLRKWIIGRRLAHIMQSFPMEHSQFDALRTLRLQVMGLCKRLTQIAFHSQNACVGTTGLIKAKHKNHDYFIFQRHRAYNLKNNIIIRASQNQLYVVKYKYTEFEYYVNNFCVTIIILILLLY